MRERSLLFLQVCISVFFPPQVLTRFEVFECDLGQQLRFVQDFFGVSTLYNGGWCKAHHPMSGLQAEAYTSVREEIEVKLTESHRTLVSVLLSSHGKLYDLIYVRQLAEFKHISKRRKRN